MKTEVPFVALWVADRGVISFARDGFTIHRQWAWLKQRGGLRAHYDDMRTGRTIPVDAIEYRPEVERPGFERTDRGLVYQATLAVAMGLAISGPVDARLLAKVFTPDDADMVMKALYTVVYKLTGEPLPPYLASPATYAEASRGIVASAPGAVVLR